MPAREYTLLLDRLPPGLSQEDAMERIVDGIWERFGLPAVGIAEGAVSWVGFYTWSRKSPDEMTLGYRRDKPACSPIGLHGACGRCFTSKRPLVVTDVANLGKGYIACDPRDRAEVVIPCLNPDGSAWGVLDIDSYDAGAFDVFDALALTRLLRHAGLTTLVAESTADVEIV